MTKAVWILFTLVAAAFLVRADKTRAVQRDADVDDEDGWRHERRGGRKNRGYHGRQGGSGWWNWGGGAIPQTGLNVNANSFRPFPEPIPNRGSRPVGIPPPAPFPEPPPNSPHRGPDGPRSGGDHKYQKEYNYYRQARTGNKAEQCPCVKQIGSDECIVYDFRYQAATLAEAILNFRDLTCGYADPSTDPSNPWRAVANSASDPFKCDDPECQLCSYVMINHLRYQKEIDEENKNRLITNFHLERYETETATNQSFSPGDCQRYNFARPKPPKPRKPNMTPQIRESMSLMKKAGDDFYHRHHNQQRGKRQTTPTDIIGDRKIISCVEQGEAETDQTHLVVMCRMCWVWRELPGDYFPAFVNELICDQDSSCLSGSGTCSQRRRNLNVLKNNGTTENPQWLPVAIPTGNCCECQVISGSPLQGLITATSP